MHLTETLIDHLDIESVILHRDQEEARLQLLDQRRTSSIVAEKMRTADQGRARVTRKYSEVQGISANYTIQCAVTIDIPRTLTSGPRMG